MPIYHSLQLIHIHVPKTAGTFLTNILFEKCGINLEHINMKKPSFDYLIGPLVLSEYQNYIHTEIKHNVQVIYKELQHLTALEIQQYIHSSTFQRYFKFAFVRNPYERLYSDYKWHNIHIQSKPTFEEWVMNIGSEKYNYHFIHLKPQSDFLFDENGNCLVTVIYKLEEFQKSEFPRNIDLELLDLKKFQTENNMDKYTQKMLNKVNSLYKKDFELLEYKMYLKVS